jgi:hypothetical protein
VRFLRSRIRGALAELMRVPVLVAAAVLAASSLASAATPAPQPAATMPAWIFPKKKLHVEVTVETNRMGQVARVRAIKPSHDYGFDAHCYGNALQAFIRTPDGNAVAGVYRLIYDYDPKPSPRVHRDVALVKAGGVNPNAKGAANDMMEIARRNHNKTPAPVSNVTPGPAPSVNIQRMPDLKQVMKGASPTPGH